MRIFGSGWTLAHLALYPQHIFVTHAFSQRKNLGISRIEYHLHQAGTVAQVDKDDTAVVAPVLRPAAQGNRPAGERGTKLPAIMTAHVFRVLKMTTERKRWLFYLKLGIYANALYKYLFFRPRHHRPHR